MRGGTSVQNHLRFRKLTVLVHSVPLPVAEGPGEACGDSLAQWVGQ